MTSGRGKARVVRRRPSLAGRVDRGRRVRHEICDPANKLLEAMTMADIEKTGFLLCGHAIDLAP